MARLDDLRNGAAVNGITAGQTVQVVSVDWIGDQAVNVVLRQPTGAIAETTLYRDDEYRLEVLVSGRPWSFDGDGGRGSRQGNTLLVS